MAVDQLGEHRPMKSVIRIRLSTMLLLVAVIGMLIPFFVLRLTQARLRAEIKPYRSPVAEGVVELLERPVPLTYKDGAPLEAFLKDLKACSNGQPKLPTGIPIYVDPIGLSESKQTMASPVRRPAPDRNLTLRAHLNLVLKPLGLGFTIRDRFLMITSDEDANGQPEDDPYLGYRDVLR